MSIAAFPIAAVALAQVASPWTKLPPRSRMIVPKPDNQATPEPR